MSAGISIGDRRSIRFPRRTGHVSPEPTKPGRFARYTRCRPPIAVQRTSHTSVRTTLGSSSPNRLPRRSGKPFSAIVHASGSNHLRFPSLVVGAAKVEGSTILHSTALTISPEFNAIIGGRGSGKSSFLEYVAFGLGRSCYDVPRNHYSGTDRMRDLVYDTLVSKGGHVSLKIVQDNAVFTILRDPTTAPSASNHLPNRLHTDGHRQGIAQSVPSGCLQPGRARRDWQTGWPAHSALRSASIREPRL